MNIVRRAICIKTTFCDSHAPGGVYSVSRAELGQPDIFVCACVCVCVCVGKLGKRANL
jgi:hypothetical protein